MRFRRLELIRYGGFANRMLDFGGGGVDFHLVVGPNEAGKSTTLEAIGDLLFGIPGQSRQNWRYDYADLRVRALIEHDDDVLDVTRRKGNRNTLLGADGSALPDEVLAPLLAGIDRRTFERMFGLDHEKLREGGQAILEGKDDAARIVLEAGTGLSGIGTELKRLDDEAATLFKPNAQIPAVNRLLRERAEALAAVRDATLTDAQWSAVKEQRREAEDRRAALLAEGQALTARAATLERLDRARRPLARLTAARSSLAALEPVPELPADADRRLAAALAERTTAAGLADQHRSTLARLEAERAQVVLPDQLLAVRARIEGLEEHRPVVEKAVATLARREADLAAIDSRLATVRAEIGVGAQAALPSPGWRKRARDHLEARRALATDAARHARTERDHEQAATRLADDLAAVPTVTGLDALRAALAAVPADAVARLADADDAVARAAKRAETALAALLPWRGSAADLAATGFPSLAAAEAHADAIDTARAAWRAAQQEAASAEAEAIRARSKLDVLNAGTQLATPEAVASARQERDAALADVRARLAADRAPDDDTAGMVLAEAIAHADRLADRRDADASRIAEHALVSAALNEAVALREAATRRAAEWSAALAAAEEQWTELLARAGFAAPVPPSGWTAWRADRDRALAALDDVGTATGARDRLAKALDAARTGLVRALAGAGLVADDTADAVSLVVTATAALERLEPAIRRREGLLTREQALAEAADALARDATALAVRCAALDADHTALLLQAGLAAGTSDTALADAIDALETAATDLSARVALAAEIDAARGDIARFDTDTSALFADLGRPAPTRAVEAVRALALELRKAVAAESQLAGLAAQTSQAQAGLESAEARARAADAAVADLMQLAAVSREEDLAPAIAASAEAVRSRASEREALTELTEIGAGQGLDALLAEVEAITPEAAAAEVAAIAERRREIEAEREEIGRTLAEAEAAARRAASESAAADAQQLAAETTAAMADAAERHVASAASAALLRWLIDRHRATSQAPLIARAGALFAQVTEQAYAGLALDYGSDDRPRIVGVRADGTRVGAEGMSEGTRDQLFLALRLGSIEGRAGTHPLPLVCDDLLINADDARAGAMLKVLAANSLWTQVLLFTHHEHVVALAQRAVGEGAFRIHRLERAGALVAT